MPMSGAGLAAAISAIPGINVTNNAELLSFCNTLITYIQTNAIVNPGQTVVVNTTTGSGATTGPGTIS